LKTGRVFEKIVETLLLMCAVSSVLIVFLLVGYVAWQGFPQVVSWSLHGFGMTWSFDPDNVASSDFGIIRTLFSTIYVGLGAVAIAVLIGLPTAIYIAEFSGPKIRNMIKPSMETLAGMPSVVMGYFGFFYICPLIFSYFGEGGKITNGQGVLAAWMILATMALPFIVSISEDAIRAVPNSYREAAQGLGATRWQTTLHVILPEAKSGIMTAVLLALGSALGETMAVIMVIGPNLNPPITLDPRPISNVLTTLIAQNVGQDSSGTGPLNSALYGVGFILFVLVGILNIAVTMLVRERKQK
jgi:phosphate ABC transporter permease protein PstC